MATAEPVTGMYQALKAAAARQVEQAASAPSVDPDSLAVDPRAHVQRGGN